MNSYTAGNLIRITAAFTSAVTQLPIDPTTVILNLKAPDATIQALSGSVVRDGLGAYHCDVTPTLVGLYVYEWEGTGALPVANLGQFLVTQGLF